MPWGMGVMEGVIITGLMAAGVPEEQAVPTTFAYRLITAYLPPVGGYPAIFWLRMHEYLSPVGAARCGGAGTACDWLRVSTRRRRHPVWTIRCGLCRRITCAARS